MKPFILTCLPSPDTGRGVGLALVLELPGGGVWLYDTGCGYPMGTGIGPDGAPHQWVGDFNAGRDLIAPFLRERGFTKIDGVVVSHAHYDHFGGLLWLEKHFPIALLVDSGYDFTGAMSAGYQRELSDFNGIRERFKARGAWKAVLGGDPIPMDPGLEVKVLAPPRGFFPDPHPEKRNPKDPASHYMLNSNALILGIRHGKKSFVLGGDIEKEDQEELLVPSLPVGALACDVLVAPGHGLHTAENFVAATRPSLVVVSLFDRWLANCTAKTLFEASGATVRITGDRGRVTVESDGERIAHR
ncbi:MAG: MBL fold metallo-hydrolase [Spirochaetes bacterium]|nr:MBL fold metallo-hydrolase [Spirochaetota bacterium]